MTKDELVKAGVPDTLHGEAVLLEAKDWSGVAKMLIDTKALVGSSIRVPGPDAGDVDRKAFRERLKTADPDLIELPKDPTEFAKVEGDLFARLGRPKEAKEYPSLKDMGIAVPEGTEISEDDLRTYGHKLGMTKKQFQEFAKGVAENKGKETTAATENKAAIKKELGTAFDERMGAAALAAKQCGLDEAFVTALRTGAVSKAQALGWIKVAQAMGTEGANLGGGNEGGAPKMTVSEAKSQIAELRKRPELTAPGMTAEKKRLMDRLVSLTAIANPDLE